MSTVDVHLGLWERGLPAQARLHILREEVQAQVLDHLGEPIGSQVWDQVAAPAWAQVEEPIWALATRQIP